MGQKADGARKGWLTTFCVGNVGYELMYEFYKNFENFFLTEICAFSTGVTTGITTVINAIKVFLTPAVGVAIDKDPFKARDKHTPWIVGMPVFLGLAFILMAWGAWKGGGGTLFVLSMYVIFQLFAPFLSNGYRSAIPSMARNSNEASFLAASVNTGSNIGRVLAGIIAPVIMVKLSADGVNEDAQGFFWAVVVSVILSIVVYWLSAYAVKKTIRPDRLRDFRQIASEAGAKAKSNALSIGEIFKQVFTDKNIMIPFIFGVCLIFRTFVVAPTAPYYYSYVVGDMLEYATFSTATNVAGVIAVIVGPLFLVKVAKNNLKGTMLLFTVCVILCHLSLLIVGHDKNWFLVTMTLGNFFYQCNSVLIFTAFVNAVDVSELRQRKLGKKDVASGTAMSLHWTAVMVAQVLGVYVRNVGLQLAGYEGANTVATAEFADGLIKMYAIVPTIFLVFSFITILFYNLTPEYMEKVHAELDPLRAADSAGASKSE